MDRTGFLDRISPLPAGVSSAEACVIDWIAQNREAALHASAAGIAKAAGTSDATVIRAARKLGYAGLSALREALARDLRRDVTLSDRMMSEMARVAEIGTASAATTTLRQTLDAIETLPPDNIARVVQAMIAARRLHVFGIGPSGHIAGYFADQLTRLGHDARAMTRTGRQCADDLVGLRSGDMVVALAYGQSYPELRALFDRVEALGLASVLVTSVGPRLPDTRAGITLRVPRGRAGGFGFHAGTVALLESLLLAVSVADPDHTKQALDALNAARQALSGPR